VPFLINLGGRILLLRRLLTAWRLKNTQFIRSQFNYLEGVLKLAPAISTITQIIDKATLFNLRIKLRLVSIIVIIFLI
jgi:hypothetical protein